MNQYEWNRRERQTKTLIWLKSGVLLVCFIELSNIRCHLRERSRISLLLWGGLGLGLGWCGLGGDGLGWGGFSGGSSLNWSGVTVGSLLLLDVLGEDLVVLSSLLLGLLESVDLLSLDQLLSSESLLSDESLDLWWFVESLVSLLDFSSHNVLSNIVLLSEVEDLSDIVGSLGAESSWLITVSDTLDLLVTLLDNSEGDHG